MNAPKAKSRLGGHYYLGNNTESADILNGAILNLASIAGREGRPSLPHYSSSKSAIVNYTQALAGELAPHNINVNAICPGLLWTPMWEQVGGRYAQNDPEYAERIRANSRRSYRERMKKKRQQQRAAKKAEKMSVDT